MKKIVSTLLVCVMLVGMIFTLVSCGKILNGKYECVISDSNRITYEFSLNKVTQTVTTGAFGYTNSKVTEGKYEINEVEENKYTITFTWDVDGEEQIETVDFSEGEENGVKFIKLGLVRYEKVN